MVVRVVKEKLGIKIALRGGLFQPAQGDFLISRDIFAEKVELAESILGILIALFCGTSKILHGMRMATDLSKSSAVISVRLENIPQKYWAKHPAPFADMRGADSQLAAIHNFVRF